MNAPEPMSGWSAITALSRALVDRFGARTAGAFALAIAVGLTEGIGLVLIMPLIALAGVESEGLGTMVTTVGTVFAWIGLTPTLTPVLGVFVGVLAARAVLHFAWKTLTESLLIDWSNQIRRALFDAWASASWPTLSRVHSATLARVLIVDVDRSYVAAALLLNIGADLVLVGLYTGLATTLSLPVTFLALATGGLLFVAFRPLVREGLRRGEENTLVNTLLHEALTDLAQGGRAVRIQGMVDALGEDFQHRLGRARNAHTDAVWANASLNLALALASAVLLAAYAWLAVGVLELDIGVIAVLALLFSRLLPRFQRLQSTLQDLFVQVDGFGSVQHLLGTLRATHHAVEGHAELPLAQSIVIEGVDYAYPEGDGMALDGLTLEIPVGQTVAIVGPSGQGKSTLADILAGLLVPDRGEVLVDGTPLGPETLASWRAGLGYVEQDSYLFHGTLRENFQRLAPEVADPQIDGALRAAHAVDIVSAQPEGLDTVHGERGVTLSGGERQRIALAMALVRDPRVLLLDEATRSVDPPTARRIRQTLAEQHGQRTIIWITHDLSSVRDADTIHVMQGGQVVQSGTWDELTATDGPFRELL